jgi:hypothetical protein
MLWFAQISFEDDTLTVGQGSSVGDKTFLTASLDDYSLSADSLYVGFAGRDSPVRVSVQQSVCPQDHWQTRSCNLQPCPGLFHFA